MTRYHTSDNKKKLSPREIEVISWVVQGMSNEEISKQMKVSVKCVKFHLSTIFKITNCPSRLKLVVSYYKKTGFFADLERKSHG